MKTERDNNASKTEMKAVSTRLYAVKSELLEDLRTGFTKLDKELVKSFSDKVRDFR